MLITSQEQKREEWEHVSNEYADVKEMLGGAGKEVEHTVILEKKTRMVFKAEKRHKFSSCKT